MTRCETCGQLIHPRFKHHHWKVKDIPMGEWTPHGRGAFRVVEYVI
jgi:DNA-directed RNA polymerase subunit N (RpoN/RPB10)